MEKKLQVKNLRISFRTSNGKVQAVRGINFDLDKGETLAIVGESGSGKSVTSKAILGILAGNSIVESGEIIYDGKDLLKISEESFALHLCDAEDNLNKSGNENKECGTKYGNLSYRCSHIGTCDNCRTCIENGEESHDRTENM